MKVRTLIASLAVAISGSAVAVTTDLGILDFGGSSFGKTFVRIFDFGSPLGEFHDHYTFELRGTSGADGGTAVAMEWGSLDLDLRSVSLTGGPAGLNTDAGGVIDGVPVPSFTEASTGGVPNSPLASSSGLDSPLVSVVFGQPDGLSFEVASGSLAVPEPDGMTLFGLGFALAACARICRRRVG